MLNYTDIFNSAPKTPAYNAVWVPVYFEPIMGSGEKFTIIIAARGEDGNIKVSSAIRPHVIKSMYGNKSNQFNKLITVISESLKNHLEIKGSFDGWTSPIQGAHLGSLVSSQSTDIIGILRQGVQLTASLSSLDFYYTSENDEYEQYSSENTWSTQLKQKIIINNPNSESFFNRQFRIGGESRACKIFYLNEKIAINTDRLIPGSGLTTHLDRNKARILDLLAVKNAEIFDRAHHELIVYRPEENDITYSKTQFQKLNQALNSIEEIGDKNDIRVVPVMSVEQAASRINRLDMVA